MTLSDIIATILLATLIGIIFYLLTKLTNSDDDWDDTWGI